MTFLRGVLSRITPTLCPGLRRPCLQLTRYVRWVVHRFGANLYRRRRFATMVPADDKISGEGASAASRLKVVELVMGRGCRRSGGNGTFPSDISPSAWTSRAVLAALATSSAHAATHERAKVQAPHPEVRTSTHYTATSETKQHTKRSPPLRHPPLQRRLALVYFAA